MPASLLGGTPQWLWNYHSASGIPQDASGGTLHVVNRPTGAERGHLLVATLWSVTAEFYPWSMPLGWVRRHQPSTISNLPYGGAFNLCTKQITGSIEDEPTSYTFTCNNSQRWIAAIFVITGADVTSLFYAKNIAVSDFYDSSTNGVYTMYAPNVAHGDVGGMLVTVGWGNENTSGGNYGTSATDGPLVEMVDRAQVDTTNTSSSILNVSVQNNLGGLQTGDRQVRLSRGPNLGGRAVAYVFPPAVPKTATRTMPTAALVTTGATVMPRKATLFTSSAQLRAATSAAAPTKAVARTKPAPLAVTATKTLRKGTAYTRTAELLADAGPYVLAPDKHLARQALLVATANGTIGRNILPTGQPTTATGATGTALTVNRPALADKSLMVAVLYTRTIGATFTPPPGWVLAAYNGTNSGLAVYTKFVLVAADETAPAYTFTASSSRWTAHCFTLAGVSPTAPIAATANSADTTTTAGLTAPSVTVDDPDGAILCVWQAHHGSVMPDLEPPAGMAKLADTDTPTGNSAVLSAFTPLVGAGATEPRTATATSTSTPAAANSSSITVAFRAGQYTPAVPVLLSTVAGNARADRFDVTAKTAATGTARLLVSTSPDFEGVAAGPPATPDERGYVRLTSPSGLLSDSTYTWGVELDNTIPAAASGTAHTLPVGAASFSFAASADAATSSNDPVFDAVRTHQGANGPMLWMQHLGNMHHADLGLGQPTLTGNYEAFENVLSQPRQADLYRSVPLVYGWGARDWAGPGQGRDSTNAALVQQTYRAVFPHYPLPADLAGDGAIYHAFSVGRVLFLTLDGRSHMTDPNDDDGPLKTKLGAAQKQWLAQQLARRDHPVKVVFGDTPWHTAPGDDTIADTWAAYPTERAELAQLVTGSAANVWYVHGGYRVLAADDGTNNHHGGFPVVCCGPLDNTPLHGQTGWSAGYWPNPADSTEPAHQYGVFDVADSGDQIAVTFTGYTSDREPRIGLTLAYATPPPFAGWGVPV